LGKYLLNTLVLNQDFEDYRGRLWFGLKGYLESTYFLPFFSPMRYASARCFEMKASFNGNPPTLANEVILNPENPDSNQWLLRTQD